LKPDFDGAQAETFKSFTTDLTTIDAFWQNKTMCHRAIASKGEGPEPWGSLFLSRTVKR
jgi:hypothetical protein